jgi:hypothetical protein
MDGYFSQNYEGFTSWVMKGSNMKKTLSFLTVGIFLLPLTAVSGSIGLATGCATTADACGFGVGNLGAILNIGDESTNILGTLSYGFSQYTEGRVKLGLSDPDAPNTDATIIFGADFKYEFMDYYDKINPAPFDMAFGGLFEWVDYDELSIMQIGGSVIGSIPYHFQSGRRLIPYGRFNIRIEHSSNRVSDSEIEFGLNVGTKYEFSSDMGIYGEFQIDGNTGLILGIDFRTF